MTQSESVQVLRIPLNRANNPDGQRLNVGAEHTDVPVVLDPDLSVLGEVGHQRGYDHVLRRVIRLREWNEQVLLHEILHVVLDPVLVLGAPEDPFGHNIIARVEVALWEAGWRISTPPGAVT